MNTIFFCFTISNKLLQPKFAISLIKVNFDYSEFMEKPLFLVVGKSPFYSVASLDAT